MASKRLPIEHISGKQASQSYACSEKYEWHNLPFNQSEQVTRGQPHLVATIRSPQHMSTRMGRYTASHGHGYSSEICGSGNGVDGPDHLSGCYVGCHGQDHASLNHSSKRARQSVSPGPGPEKPYRSTRSRSFGHVQRYAKGPDRDTCKAVSGRKNFSVNQERQYHEDRYPTKNDFLNGIFSEKDAAKHRCYMRSFYPCNKQDNHCLEEKDPMSNISDHTSHGQSHRRDEVVRDHSKRQIHEFRAIHEQQLELSQKYSHKHTYNDASACKYVVNSDLKMNADHLDGKRARTNVGYQDKSKRVFYPDGQDQELHVESEKIRNDIAEGNDQAINPEDPNGAKGNGNPKKNSITVNASGGLRKWDENSNMQIPNGMSEGSKSMDLESDQESSVQGCPKRGTLQHLSELRQDCLKLWRARRLRKGNASEADKFLQANKQHTAQRSKMSTGGRVRNRRPAALASSESEGDSASECSDQFSAVKSYEMLKKHGEERGNKKLDWDLSCPSIHKCDRSTRNIRDKEALTCSMELQPEANTGQVVLQYEQEKLVCHQLSTDCKTQTRLSDTSKVDHTVVTRPDNGVPQNVSHQGSDNENFDEKRNGRLFCQNRKETETSGTELAKKIDDLCNGSALLDQNNFAICPKHEILKVNASDLSNHGSGTTTFNRSELDRGVNKFQKRHVRSCESYCRDFKNWLYRSGCNDIQPETMNLNILRTKQEYSVLADTENKMNQKATKGDFHALQTPAASSYEQISHHRTLDTAASGAPNREDSSSIPDLNLLPSMVADEGSVPYEEPVCQVDDHSIQSMEIVCQVDEDSIPSEQLVCQVDECSVPSEELICQVASDRSKPQFGTKSLSNSLSAPARKEEQLKQAESTQFAGEVCEKGTSESAGRVQISDSNTGPPQLSTAAESSTSIDAFKIALCEFIKNILKPLCDDGLLTREVHKIIVKKAVEKVTGVWGSIAPSTEIAISRVLSDESQNLYNLVQGYLELYVGRGVLKKYA